VRFISYDVSDSVVLPFYFPERAAKEEQARRETHSGSRVRGGVRRRKVDVSQNVNLNHVLRFLLTSKSKLISYFAINVFYKTHFMNALLNIQKIIIVFLAAIQCIT
jgi:hypothetical protein